MPDSLTGQAIAAAGALIPTGAVNSSNVGNQFISNYNFDTINIRETVDIYSIPDWQFLDDTYTGQGHYKDGKYLVPHPRESAYNRRRQLAVYRNYFKKIVSAKEKPIFNEEITRITSNSTLQNFLKDVDNNKTGIQDFMERIAIDAIVKGVSFVVMDNFAALEIPATINDIEDQRKFPYIYIKTKGDVAAYELDMFGNIETITFNDKDVVVNKTPNGKDKTEKRYRMWTEMYSQIMKYNMKTRKYEPAGPQVMHNLGIVPVYPMFTAKRDNDELLPASEMWDLAKLCWSLFGIDSEIRQQVRDQCFSVFYYQGDNSNMITLGVANALALPMETKVIPGFAQPDPQTLAGNIAYANDIHAAMLELAEQHGVTGVQKQISGEAKAWDFQANNETVKSLALICKNTEIWIVNCFGLYIKQTLDFDAQYKDNYAPHSYVEDLKVLQAGLDNNISPKTNVEIKKAMVSVIFSEKEPDELIELYDDIENESSAAVEAQKAEAMRAQFTSMPKM